MRWSLLIVFVIAVIGYLFIGAAVFQALESDHEQGTKTMSRDKIVKFLSMHINNVDNLFKTS